MGRKILEITIIIIDQEEKIALTLRPIIAELSNVRILGETKDLLSGFEIAKKLSPNITIINLQPQEEQILQFTERLTHHLPNTTVFVTSSQAKPELIIKAMRAGAREFLMQPFRKDELTSAIRSVEKQLKTSSKDEREKGKILTVFGVKGGVGATTIATNLATAFSKNTGKDVILLDLNLQLGNASLYLDIQPKYSILDVANNIETIDPELLKSTLPKHESGVRLLAGPLKMEEAEAIKVNHIDQTFDLLKSIFDFIIIDTNNMFDEITIRALDESDILLPVTTLDIASVYNAKRCLKLFERMGYGREKVLLTLNRHASYDGLDLEVMENSLDYPVFWRIPNQDFTSVMRSINEGTPITILMPRSKLSINILEMVKNFNGTLGLEVKSDKKKPKTQILKKFLGQRSK